ncbi:MAG TPA: Ku protein [Stellaceae bacterium]|nr:Ku protein [Stellaceae bacterium]
MPPRPSWSGHLRLSLVSCPISLAPAVSESERIRLHQINPATGNRISLRPVDAETGEALERKDLVKGYELDDGRYVILEPEELKELQVESTRILDLTTFVDRKSIDPLYVSDPYFIYPEKSGRDAYRVIAEALSSKKRAALGRIVLSTREHPVMVEPFEGGLVMTLLRAANEVRQAGFDFGGGKLDPKMVELAETIMDRMSGKFDPADFHDRYQDELRKLIEAKAKGMPKPKHAPVAEPSNVIDLMAALKRSLAEKGQARETPVARKKHVDRRQGNLLLPVEGKGRKEAKPVARQRETAQRETTKTGRKRKAS